MLRLKKNLWGVFQSVKEHKALFALLVVLQIFFFLSIGGLIFNYQIKIFADIEGIVGPLQNANYDAQSLQSGQPFIQDILRVYHSYRTLMKDLLYLFLEVALIFLLLEGMAWILSHHLLEPKGKPKLFIIKEAGKRGLKFLVSSVTLFGPLLLLAYFILVSMMKKQMDPDLVLSAVKIIFYAGLVVGYFWLAALALISLSLWGEFVRGWLKCSLKRIHLTLLILSLLLPILFLSLYLVYWTLKYPYFSLIILSSLFFFVVLVLARLFWIASLRELATDEKNYH